MFGYSGNEFIKLNRKILNWEWFTDVNTCHLFIYCLLKANWRETEWRGRRIKRGQFVTSTSKLASKIGLTIRQTRTALEHLKKTGEVTSETTPQYSIITVINYDKYQGEGKRKGKQKGKQTTSQTASKTTTIEEIYKKDTTYLKEDKKAARPQSCPSGGYEGPDGFIDPMLEYYRERGGYDGL